MTGLLGPPVHPYRELQRRYGIKANWEVEPDLPMVTTDAGKLEAIYANLIVNAFKYTSRGEVRIGLKSLPASKVVEFAVADTGEGISSDELAKVFDQFHWVHGKGSVEGVGLGLTIVKKYLEFLHGSIRVESEPRRGSTFRVRVPIKLT
jgi:signal transduction histidine kinase